MGLLLPVAALLLIAGKIDVDATVVAEARGGEAPLQAGGPSRTGVVGVLTPGGDLELRRLDTNIRLDYGARIYWRQPNESGACPIGMATCFSTDRSSRLSPLILHIATLTASSRRSDRLTLSGGASMSVGEADYSTLPQLLGGATRSVQATLPTVIDILSLSARAGALVAANPIWSFGLAADVNHRRPLGSQGEQDLNDPTMSTLTTLPRQTTLLAEPTAIARLTRQDDLLLLDPVSYQTYSTSFANGVPTPGATFLIIAPQVGWRTHLSRRYDLRLVAGFAYLQSLGPTPMGRAPTPFIPVGAAELRGRLYRYDGMAMQLTFGTTVDYYVDPILAQAAPRGTATARCNVLFSKDWAGGVEGLFATTLTAQPFSIQTAGGMTVSANQDETVASLWVPMRHRVSDHLIFEFGGRWSDRAPHVRAASFAFHQREFWAYVMLTATTRRLGLWTTP